MNAPRGVARRLLYLLAAVVAGAALGLVPASTPPSPPGGGPARYRPHLPGELLLKFKKQALPSDRAAVRAQVAARRLRRFRSGAEHWKLGRGLTTEKAVALLERHPHLEYVEPNYVVSADLIPDDPSFPTLWGLRNTGQTGGTPGADIDVERAWDATTGSRAVVVGVIDTGIDCGHPDLAANIWTNSGEVPGNGIDDDGNGYIDDVRGWDFVNDDNDPTDDHGHGTHVAGTIGAVGDNAVGVAGINWEVSLIPLKFLASNGMGSTADAVAALDYATLMGADVTNNSWGGGSFSQALLDAILSAAAADSLFVASAGNDGTDNDFVPHYPSSYEAPNVVAVASTDDDDNKAISSNFGASTVDLGAPGVGILSTLPGGSYGFRSGTSMAAPHVTGVAALIRSIVPGFRVDTLKRAILDFAEPIPALAGITATGGRLNAFNSVVAPDDTPPGSIDDLVAENPTSNSVYLRWTATGDDGDSGYATSYDVRYATDPIDEANFLAATPAAGAPAPAPAGAEETMEVMGLATETTYHFALRALDEWGAAGPVSNPAAATTLPPPTLASSPDEFFVSLLSGQTATRSLLIENVGVGTLDWRIPTPSLAGTSSAQQEPLPLAKGEEDSRVGPPVTGSSGGPDPFGYRFVDSDLPGGPAFIWRDIALSGTAIGSLDGDDQLSEAIPIGFDFPFYGGLFDAVRVSTDGWLSFTSTDPSPVHQPVPCTGTPENLVAPFWTDLDFGGTARAVYVRDWDSFTVQFTEVRRAGGSGSYTFQVVLRETGEILFQYLSIDGDLSRATIGIQNETRTSALQVAFNTAYLHDAHAVLIDPTPRWLTVDPDEGRLFAAQQETVTLSFDARGLSGGTYTGTVDVETNDPSSPLAAHDATLEVTDAPAIEVDAAELDFGETFVGFSAIRPLGITNIGTADLMVDAVTVGDPAVAADPASFILPAGASQSVSVVFTPAAPGVLNDTVTIESDASNAPLIVLPVLGSASPPPEIQVDPQSLAATLLTGQTGTAALRVTNTGQSDLAVTLSAELLPASSGFVPSWPGKPKGDESENGAGAGSAGAAGAVTGTQRYSLRESDDRNGPAFDWQEISESGEIVPVKGDDEVSDPIPIGFPFPFFGESFESVHVSTNGWLSFSSNDGGYSNPDTLPNAGRSIPESLVAPFFDDLDFGGVPRATYHSDGSRFVVQYTDVPRATAGSSLTFQAILHPDGRIAFQYLSMAGVLDSATIGLQGPARAEGLLISYNEPYVHDGLALEITPLPPVVNGGFESGDFSGWTATSNGLQGLTPWTVTGPAAGYFGNSNPPEGGFDALNGFDGAAGLTYTLSREISVLPGAAQAELTYYDRIQFDSFGTPSSLPRIYEATVRNLAGDVLALIVHEEILLDGRPYTDLGWQRRSVDLAPFAGQTIRIRIDEYIPESFTGPAVIEFDDFRTAGQALPQWLSVTPSAGTVPPGGFQDFSVAFDATGSGTTVYYGAVRIDTSSPAAPAVRVPAVLSVIGAPDIAVHRSPIALESVQDYLGSGARTSHAFTITEPPAGGGSIEIIAEGDYGVASETATVLAEGVSVGSTGGTGTDCAPATDLFPLDSALVGALAADGFVEVEVQNSQDVGSFCTLNRHTIRFLYEPPSGELDFGSLFAGASADLSLIVENRGSDPLQVLSVSSDVPEFSASPAAFSVAPGFSQTILITFVPSTAGQFAGTLSVASDDPDTPLVSLDLTGTGLEPPVIGVHPGSLSSTLFAGDQETQILTISNTGGAALEFSLSVQAGASGTVTVPFTGLTSGSRDISNNPSPAEDDLPSSPSGEIGAPDGGEPAEPVDHGEDPPGVRGTPGTFEFLADSPVPLTCVAADPAAGIVYGQTNEGAGFYRYVAAADRWETLAPAPLNSGNNGGAALLNGRIYTSYTQDAGALGVYEISTDTWTTIPHPLPNGTANIASDGTQYLYLVAGNLLVRFDPVTSTTTVLAPPPFYFERWGGLEYLAGTLYGHQGNGSQGFAAYDIPIDRWRTLAPLPAGGVLGAAIDPVAREYFAYGSYGGSNLFRYSIARGSWSASNTPLSPVLDGGLGWLPAPVPGIHIVEGEGGTRFVRLVTAPSFLSLDPVSGTVPPAGSLDVSALFDTTQLVAGDYDTRIEIQSNDPVDPQVALTASLTVIGEPNIALSGEQVTLESSLPFTGGGARTSHAFPLADPPDAGGSIQVTAEGDFGTATETATISAEGLTLGAVGGTGFDCAPALGNFQVSAEELSNLATDGVVRIDVQNAPLVDAFCAVNRHTVQLSYTLTFDPLEFGPVYLGFDRTRMLFVENRGTDLLNVISVTSDVPEFSAPPSGFPLAPGHSRPVAITFTPSSEATFNGTLTIASDDPDTPDLRVDLTGAGLAPPIVDVDPPALSSTLFSGDQETRTFTISNSGGSPLEFSLRLSPHSGGSEALVGGEACSLTIALVSEWISGELSEVDLGTGLIAQAASGLSTPNQGLAVSRDGGTAYVTESGSGTVAKVNLETGTVARVASSLNFPVGLALSGDGTTVYVTQVQSGELTAIDLGTGVATPVASGLDLPNGVALDSAESYALVAEYGGRVSRVDLAAGAVSLVAAGLDSPSSVALDPSESAVYITESAGGKLSKIDLVTGAVSLVASGFDGPASVALDETGTIGFVTEGNGGRLSRVDLTLGAVNPVATGLALPLGVALLPPPECRLGHLTLDLLSGAVPPSGSLDVTARFDAAELFAGTYGTDIELSSNDPARPLVMIPAVLTVLGEPEIGVTVEPVTVESKKTFAASGASTSHILMVGAPPSGDGSIRLIAEGDFGASTKLATLTVEGVDLGAVGSAGTDCFPVSGSFPLSAPDLASLAADGVILADVQNSAEVDAFCGTNRHTVILTYDLPAGQLPFGSLFVGYSRTLSIRIENDGTDVLDVTSISSDLPEFVASPGTVLIPPASFRIVAVTFTPSTASEFPGTLIIRSDDPDSPEVTLPVIGTGVEPPVISVWPTSLSSVLYEGDSETQVLTISNSGGSSLRFSLSAALPDGSPYLSYDPTAGSVPPSGSLDVLVTFDAGALTRGRYLGAITISSNDPLSTSLVIPVRLKVEGIPDIRVSTGPTGVDLESTEEFFPLTPFTLHHLAPAPDPEAGGVLEVVAEGDFAGPGKTVRIYAEGAFLGSPPPGGGSGCITVSTTIPMSAQLLGFLVADGAADVRVINSLSVDPICSVNRHTVRLRYQAADPDSIDFGEVFIGGSSQRTFIVESVGTGPLHIDSITGDHPDFSASPTSFTLPSGASQTVTATFAPTSAGSLMGALTVHSDDLDTPAVPLAVMGVGVPPPVAQVEPSEIQLALPPGAAATQTLRLSNAGLSDLAWNLDGNVLTATGEEPAGAAGRRGGPDPVGYSFSDSDSPDGPEYDWIEITGLGSPVPISGDDETSDAIPLGFSFPFYGQAYTSVHVSSNGWLSFTEAGTSYLDPGRLPDASASSPANLIAPFWDDLDLEGVEKVTYLSDGSRFIVQFTGVAQLGFDSDLTFQVILEPTGRIRFQYLSISGRTANATIGIQNGDRSTGLLVGAREEYVRDGLAAEVTPPLPGWITAAPASGTILPGGATDIVLSISSTGLPDGDYRAIVPVYSNDPLHGRINVPVLLHSGEVLLDYIQVDPATLNLASQGKTVRAALQLPPLYDPHDVVISTVSLNGHVFAKPKPISFEDGNRDGVEELVVKFDRAAVEAILPEGSSIPVTVTGEVRKTIWFKGTATIRAIRPQLTHPNGGEFLLLGEAVTITWNPPAWQGAVEYNVLLSRDGGERWDQLVSGATGLSFLWTADGPLTAQALIRVLVADSRGVLGYDTGDGSFVIADALRPPRAVSTLTADADPRDLILSWSRPAPDLTHGPVERYRVLQAASAEGPFLQVGTATTESFRIPHAGGPGSVLFIKVIPRNAAGDAAGPDGG
jgi:subtilisin family serine protease/DNA-binding beta-propeller fold protein YncE